MPKPNPSNCCGSCKQCPTMDTLFASCSYGNFTLNYIGGSGGSNWEKEPDTGIFSQFILMCTNNASGDQGWACFVSDCAGGNFSVTVNSCAPLDVVVHVTEFYEGCGKNVDVHVVEDELLL